MYHAARYSRDGWAGEPESEPDADLLSTPVEGWELLPKHCLELSYQAVLRERFVIAGKPPRFS
jgi:protein phosphatase PTC7